MSKKNKYIRSAFNYTGAKHKLLTQILPLFPPEKEFVNFIDLFTGGGSVALNINCRRQIIMNDINEHVINTYKVFQKLDYSVLLQKVKDIIKSYHLSNTSLNGYEYYKSNSSKGVGQYNKPYFLQLRADFNKKIFSEVDQAVVFYILTVFAFNNQIRFNSRGEYNLPVGKRDFNSSMEKKLKLFHETIRNKDIIFKNKDFKRIKFITQNDFIYADPPYSITTATYTENGKWSQKNDQKLYMYLDRMSNKGLKFALSNVTHHNGKENTALNEWATKYNIHYLDFDYNNSNYQSNARKKETNEVLITNY